MTEGKEDTAGCLPAAVWLSGCLSGCREQALVRSPTNAAGPPDRQTPLIHIASRSLTAISQALQYGYGVCTEYSKEHWWVREYSVVLRAP